MACLCAIFSPGRQENPYNFWRNYATYLEQNSLLLHMQTISQKIVNYRFAKYSCNSSSSCIHIYICNDLFQKDTQMKKSELCIVLILWFFVFQLSRQAKKNPNLWQTSQEIYCYCREMKLLNIFFVGLWDQPASHMPTSNRFSVQNQQPMAKFKFSVKEVYTSMMLVMEIRSKESAAEQYGRSLYKSLGERGRSKFLKS